MSQYNVSPTTMEQIPPEGLVMVKRRAVPNTCAFMRLKNKVKTIEGIHLLNLLGENNPKSV